MSSEGDMNVETSCARGTRHHGYLSLSMPLVLNPIEQPENVSTRCKRRTVSVGNCILTDPEDYNEIPSPICVLDHRDNFVILGWNSSLEDLTGVQSQSAIR